VSFTIKWQLNNYTYFVLITVCGAAALSQHVTLKHKKIWSCVAYSIYNLTVSTKTQRRQWRHVQLQAAIMHRVARSLNKIIFILIIKPIVFFFFFFLWC
jgi:hypothetical protein